MGIFRVRVRIFNLREEERSRDIELVVDTGATFPVIPKELAGVGPRPSLKSRWLAAEGLIRLGPVRPHLTHVNR